MLVMYKPGKSCNGKSPICGFFQRNGHQKPRLQDFDDLTEGDPEVREVLDSSPAAGYDAWDVLTHGAPILQSEHDIATYGSKDLVF